MADEKNMIGSVTLYLREEEEGHMTLFIGEAKNPKPSGGLTAIGVVQADGSAWKKALRRAIGGQAAFLASIMMPEPEPEPEPELVEPEPE